MTVRRRIERGDECVPALGVERENAPVRKPSLRLAKGGVEHKFTDGFAFCAGRRLQSVLSGARQPQVQFFCSSDAFHHLSPRCYPIPHLPDNVMTKIALVNQSFM